MAVWDIKPRTVGELLDASFFVYRRQFFRLAGIAVLFSIPAMVIVTLNADRASAFLLEFWDWFQASQRHPNPNFGEVLSDEFRIIGKIQPLAILSSALQSLSRGATFACMAVVASAALRREKAASISSVVKAAAGRIPAAVLAQAVVDYFVGLGFSCCLVPGILLAVICAPIVPVIALERGSMERSVRSKMPAALRWAVLPFAIALDGLLRTLSLGMHGPTIARGTLFLFFVFTFVGIANAAAMGAATLLISATSAWFWAQHYSEALVLPVWGLALALWYTEVRVRREGLDLVVAG